MEAVTEKASIAYAFASTKERNIPGVDTKRRAAINPIELSNKAFPNRKVAITAKIPKMTDGKRKPNSSFEYLIDSCTRKKYKGG